MATEKTITQKEAKQKIEKLTRELERHNHLYYVKNSPEISDAEFDSMLKELIELEGLYPNLVKPDSPTQRVAGAVAEGFNQVTHRVPMMSIDNISSDDEAFEFDNRIKKLLDTSDDIEYLTEPKFDGVSASLIYEQGLLTTAATRGDGFKGENVTANIKTINSIPLRLRRGSDTPSLIEIRGEVIFPLASFKRLNEDLAREGEPVFSNPRNAASGALRQLDSSVTATRPLDYFAWGIGAVEGYEIGTETEVIDSLREWGFRVEQRIMHYRNIDEAISFQHEMEASRDDLPYEADGIVIKVNRKDYQRELGTTAKHPRWSIAYKFKPRQSTTKINDITVQVGRVGLLTPVAELEPVAIGGITVKRASLHTDDIIKERDIRIGDTVLVQRAGDVIPEVVMPIIDKRTGDEKEFSMPENCPSCNTLVERDGSYYYCPNLSCPAQLKGRITHLASRKAFDIEGLGEKIVEQLMDEKLIIDMADVFYLKKQDVLPLERFAEKSTSNLIEEIEKSKKTAFDRFIYSLSIRHVGQRLAQILAENFSSIDDFMHTSEEFLIEIHTVGGEIAKSIVHFFEDKKHRDLVSKLIDSGIEIQYARKTASSNKLKGQTFVFTGTLENITRDQANEIVHNLGGRATTSVTKKTTYVVVGNDPGSKYEKAKSLSIEVLTEEDFKKLTDGD